MQTDSKVIRKRFKSAIKRGTGEAHLIMMENPQMDFSKDIIKAALKNYAYDKQSEGSRALYVFELIGLSNQKERLREEILHGLENEREDTWALDQLFDLAAFFAKQGDKAAKKAIYKKYKQKCIPDSEWLGEDVIINIDGLEGLMYIVEMNGKALDKNQDYWVDSFLTDDFQKDNTELKVYEELENAAKDNKYIKTYLEAIQKDGPEKKAIKRPVYNYEIVNERIERNFISPIQGNLVKDLSEPDIMKLAEDFLNSKTRIKQEKYLRIFDRVKYPFDYRDLLFHAKRPYSGRDRLVEYAVNSLRFFNSDDIRNFALEKLRGKAINPDIYTNLLIANYKTGDAQLLTEIVNNARTEARVHGLVVSYIDIYKANNTSDCKMPLLALYGKLTCGLCRHEIVKIMIENKVLPDEIRREIRYDSLLSTRGLI